MDDIAAAGGVSAPTTSSIVVAKATVADVPDIHAVVTVFADRGEMLHRPLNELY